MTQQISEEVIAECLRHQVAPVALTPQYLTIAAIQGQPLHQVTASLAFTCGRQVKIEYWPRIKIEQYLSELSHRRPDRALLEAAGHQQPAEISTTQEHDDEPVVQFINQVIHQALKRRASDIHFEPYANHFRIRLRIDGALQEAASPPVVLAPQLVARLKIMARLNIAERRLPQDGQLTFLHDKQERALRISTLPVSDGEKVVLRVMESEQHQQSIDTLGMSDAEQQLYIQMLQQPQGMILVTGPTGSGKTITLYSGLRLLNDASRNICSVEDPVEIPTSGINQTQVNNKIGVTFNTALRAFLRQDPDVLMVGEIRDKETAEIAIEAAQTGHLVLATLHTNSAAETLTRLGQMGIPDYLLASSLKLIVAQRLIRCLCPYCKQQRSEPDNIHIEQGNISCHTFDAVGCEHCVRGYYGRTGLYEMLVINEDIRHGLLASQPASQLHRLACHHGMTSLLQAGAALVKQGKTSLAELYRTLGSSAESTLS
ncbi:type II secretion system protein GspE [Budviciaceae bacterium BWR-B9]|uniref:Type II secretion system protein GspE n=1 Tax=Limnobaculum allomyrinae TaxID=2791986 RepID=A0ABS1INJ9_9GAMM|nr:MULTISPECIES: type II secretion system protein GspE [Limnobaculum]MBK5143324.1 type II secretion system protein GspE [Limnobaculum allomyrinae]MBV7691212.1 type II secretion system protein GspE [Limnobaculum sp. M2-1]